LSCLFFLRTQKRFLTAQRQRQERRGSSLAGPRGGEETRAEAGMQPCRRQGKRRVAQVAPFLLRAGKEQGALGQGCPELHLCRGDFGALHVHQGIWKEVI